MPSRTLFIVGPHDMAWGGIRGTIQAISDLTIVGDLSDADSAVTAVVSAEPDIALVAVATCGETLAAHLWEIQTRAPRTILVVVGDGFDAELLIALVEAGIVGYVVWSEMSLEMLHQFLSLELESTALPMSLGAMREALDALRRRTASITTREQEILALVAKGRTNQAIAEQLVISRATVRSHVSSLMRKLGANTRSELIALAHERRFL